MSSKGFLIIYIFLFFLIMKYKSQYLSSGLNALNNFLYLSRISKYYNQSKEKICSLNDGSDCFFTENKYIQTILSTKSDALATQDWVQYLSKINNFNYKDILYHLSQQTSNYIDLYSEAIDKVQNPPEDKLFIIMTFDDDTTKPNMYLHQLKATFYNEMIIANFKGKLRLSDKYQDENKEKIPNYPDKLYGIIESDSVSISFKGKLFLFTSAYIRAQNEKSKSEKISFYGFVGEQIVYGYSYSDSSRKERNWLKVLSHTNIPADKLVISGPYEIDNLEFIFYYETNVDFNDIYDMKKNKMTKRLINDDDI